MWTIKEVSEQLGLSKSTLRFWEKEFRGYFCPLRTQGGQRRYNQHHLSILKIINAKKREGLSLAEIKRCFMTNGLRQCSKDGLDIESLTERIVSAVTTELLNFFKDQTIDTE